MLTADSEKSLNALKCSTDKSTTSFLVLLFLSFLGKNEGGTLSTSSRPLNQFYRVSAGHVHSNSTLYGMQDCGEAYGKKTSSQLEKHIHQQPVSAVGKTSFHPYTAVFTSEFCGCFFQGNHSSLDGLSTS